MPLLSCGTCGREPVVKRFQGMSLTSMPFVYVSDLLSGINRNFGAWPRTEIFRGR